MAWYSDSLFTAEIDDDYSLDQIVSPAFRLSVNISRFVGTPYDNVEPFEALFDVFKPFLQRDTQRLLFIEEAGGKPRRRKSVTADDWQPFAYQRECHPDDDRYFIGFDYQSGFDKKAWPKPSDVPTGYIRYDTGPTKFMSRDDRSGRLEASIPVSDFESGALDVEALKTAMLDLPVFGALAGFGLCHSDTFDWAHGCDSALGDVARKYPVLDVCGSENRRFWSDDHDHDTTEHWIPGINWLTLVRDPYLGALGGSKAITDGLDSAISWTENDGGVLFQLGDRPITGEAGIDEDLLQLYFELGARLKPLGEGAPSLSRPWQSPFGEYDDDDMLLEDSVMWARRFYDQKWFGGQTG